MTAIFRPGRARGTVAAPPSKSMAHRYLICAGLSAGSTVHGVAFSEDIRATLDGLTALGAAYTADGATVRIGGADPLVRPQAPLRCRESGSTLRFLLPLCLLSGEDVKLSGSERLFQRSLAVYRELCEAQGLRFDESPCAVTVRGPLRPGRYPVRGDVSSQFISGLLLALPLLEGDSELHITGALESASYLRMTVQAMRDFGVEPERPEERVFRIRGGQRYAPREVTVEGDYSNAVFLEALNRWGGDVTVTGLPEVTGQGDAVYRELLARLREGEADINLSDCPDLGPVLMAVAAIGQGARFTGTRRLKIKESDRGRAMAEELRKCGVRTELGENEITVYGGTLCAPTAPLCGHNDHRIVMALSVLCTALGGRIEGAEAVAKSFPDFFEVLQSLGVDVKVESA